MDASSKNDALSVLRAAISEIKSAPVDVADSEFYDMNMIEDFGLDSLDMMTLLFHVEQHYDVKIPEPDIDEKNLIKIGNMADYLVDATTRGT